MQRRGTLVCVSVLVAGLLWPWSAHAGCGQSFCTIDARVGTAAPLAAGQLRFDTNVEYIEQDQPWVGYHPVGVGAIARPDHQEVETTNVTWKLLTELAIGDHWSASVLLPVVHREHLHLEAVDGDHAHRHRRNRTARSARSDDPYDDPFDDEDTETIDHATGVPQRWDFTRVGDLQLVGRYTLLRALVPGEFGACLFAGLKLPTGDTNVRNGDGEEAELTLQPGTGSVDPIFGADVRSLFAVPGLRGAPVTLPAFAGVFVKTPGSDGSHGYRPGTDLLVNVGGSYPLATRLFAQGQINFRYRDRDHVGNAPGVRREDTGGEYLYLSPGLSVTPTDRLAGYAYVQIPVMQRVNGIQLVSEWNLLVGLNYVFDI